MKIRTKLFLAVSCIALCGNMATVAFAQQDTGFQERYAGNLEIGESYITITNTGANGAPALGPGLFGTNTATGNICVNVYAFDPNEELISCCSCLVTPDQTVNLGVNYDLTSQTLTGAATIPSSVTVALVATLAGTGGSGSTCQYTAGIGGTVVNGMAAWGTSLHGTGPYFGSAPYSTTETPFTPVSGSAGGTGSNLASLVGRCASIIGNGSGHGICRSCTIGASLGAS